MSDYIRPANWVQHSFAQQQILETDVCKGSIAAEIRCLSHVRSASNNGLMSDVAASRFRAKRRHRVDYSIRSSASSCIETGTASPSVFAVLRLMTNSNFVGRTTGRSTGFAPLRIRPA